MTMANLKLTTYMSTDPIFKIVNRSNHIYDTKEITAKLRIAYEGFMRGVDYASNSSDSPDFQGTINELMDLMDHVLYDVMRITNYSLKIAPVNDIDNLEDGFELHPGFLLILSGAHVQVRVSGSDEFLKKISTQAIGDLEDALTMYLELNTDIVFTEICKLPDFYNIGMKYTVEVVEDDAYDKTYIVNINEIEEEKTYNVNVKEIEEKEKEEV